MSDETDMLPGITGLLARGVHEAGEQAIDGQQRALPSVDMQMDDDSVTKFVLDAALLLLLVVGPFVLTKQQVYPGGVAHRL